MATPKKKISRSRRDKRRYSKANQLRPETVATSPFTGEPIRPHRITLETIDEYIKARAERKAASTSA
jgi:ribosomal protein L32